MKNIDKILENINEYNPEEGSLIDKETKDGIYERTIEKINEKKNEKKIIKFKTRSKIFTKIAAAVIVLLLIPGTVALAAKLVQMDEKMANFFGRGAGEDAELINNIQDVSKEDVVDGVSVSINQVLGDDTGFYALLKVSGFTDEMMDRIGYRSITFDDVNLVINNKEKPEISGLINMGIGYEQGEFYFIIKVNSSKVIDSEITLTMKNLMAGSDGDSYEHILDGTWEISFKPEYTNESVDYNVNKQVSIDGQEYMWDSISISPLSVTVKVSGTDKNKLDKDSAGKLFYVDFSDGSRLDARYAGNNRFYCENNLCVISFDRIHNIEDVTAVTFGEETYLLGEGKLMEKVLYENDEMGFTLLIPAEINDIMTVKTVNDYHDDNFDEDGKCAVFTLTKDGVSIDAFTIYELEGEYSEEQVSKKNPMATYLMNSNGKTYIMQYGEIVDDRQMEVFPDIMNKYVAYINNFFNLK